MPLIRPCADLRNNYNEISKICHETNEPIYITRNGVNDLVILSDENYESLKKSFTEAEEERIDKLVSEHFDKHFASFEEFQKDVFEHINKALKDVEEGNYCTLEELCTEMEETYGFNK